MKKILTLLLLCSQSLFSQTIYHVKPSGSDNNDGLSWAMAFKTPQKALSAAASGSQIWVAAGTYYPDEGAGQTNNNRLAYFSLRSGVALYGGFAGTETDLSQRNLAVNETILSGDIDQVAGNGANAIHVVYSNSDDRSAVLDGFTITGGSANTNEYPYGGGMRMDDSSPTISNCTFTGNYAYYNGGGMYNKKSSPLITNCIFSGNYARVYGGAICNQNSDSKIINCTITGNDVDNSGGGIFSEYSNPAVINSILWGNTYKDIANGIIGSTAVTYSIVQGGYSGTGNLDTDPLFVNAAGGDLHLKGCSPAINSATATGAPAVDIEG